MARTLQVWLLALRVPSFTASVIPVLVGTAAGAEDVFKPGLFVFALLGSMALQGGTNLVNDYYDHMLGVDAGVSLGPSGVIQRGLLSPLTVLIGGFIAFGVGAAFGVAIAVAAGWPVLVLGIASVAAGYAYTAPPFKLAYRGLGELTTFAFMGTAIVMGSAYIQEGAWSRDAFLASLPVGLLTAAILHANNLRDIEGDRAHGKRTLASLVGRPLADFEMALLVLGTFVIAAILISTGDAPLTALIALAAMPVAVRLLLSLARAGDTLALNRVLMTSIGLHLLFGLLWALAFAAAAWGD